MTKGILGRKIGMTQVFGENGELTSYSSTSKCSIKRIKLS